MRPVRRLPAAFAIAALVAGAGPAVAAGTDAARIVEVGWWSRDPSATAPPGGFTVESSPTGPLAIAALRIETSAVRVLSARLVLAEQGGVRTDAARLEACATSSSWKAASRGAWEEAPKPECDRLRIPLQREDGPDVWRADITQFFAAGASSPVSVVVVPAPPAGPVPLEGGFRVQFSGATLVSEGDGEVEGAVAEPVAVAPAVASEPPAEATGESQPFAPQFDAAPVVEPAVPPRAAPAGEEAAPSPLLAEPGASFQRVAPVAGGGSGKPWYRLVGLVPLSALAGAVAAGARHAWRTRRWLDA